MSLTLSHKYGWKRDLPDFRDKKYKVASKTLRTLPAYVNLTTAKVPVQDQQALGSCGWNAIADVHLAAQIKENSVNPFNPSRLFGYYNTRKVCGETAIDSGISIRDGIKSIAKEGVCSEDLWPYDIWRFTEKPPIECYTEALKNQAVFYSKLEQTEDNLRGCLAEGFRFIFGISVFDSFESQEVADTGKVPLPKTDGSESNLGGHCMTACGYDDVNKHFIVQNSYGENWGIFGFCHIPYSYLTNLGLASDCWVIKTVEKNDEFTEAESMFGKMWRKIFKG